MAFLFSTSPVRSVHIDKKTTQSITDTLADKLASTFLFAGMPQQNLQRMYNNALVTGQISAGVLHPETSPDPDITCHCEVNKMMWPKGTVTSGPGLSPAAFALLV